MLSLPILSEDFSYGTLCYDAAQQHLQFVQADTMNKTVFGTKEDCQINHIIPLHLEIKVGCNLFRFQFTCEPKEIELKMKKLAAEKNFQITPTTDWSTRAATPGSTCNPWDIDEQDLVPLQAYVEAIVPPAQEKTATTEVTTPIQVESPTKNRDAAEELKCITCKMGGFQMDDLLGYALVKHCMQHSTWKTFRCSTCSHVERYRSHLNRHLNSEHAGRAYLIDDSCRQSYQALRDASVYNFPTHRSLIERVIRKKIMRLEHEKANSVTVDGQTTIGEDPSKTPPYTPRSPDEHGNNKRKKLQPPIENLVPDETVSSTADEISSNSDRQKIIELENVIQSLNLEVIQLEAERAARQPQEGPIVKDEPEDNPNAILKREIQELKQKDKEQSALIADLLIKVERYKKLFPCYTID